MIDRGDVAERIAGWYAGHARDLPWRRADATPWGILVSEVMLQQTPVARVLGPWAAWLDRWPTPASLAAEPAGAAVASWGRLGYPRRARRLYEAAVEIGTRHGGAVPATYAELVALPGVGDYTAAAVASFAFGDRRAVLDTNVRRVLGRVEAGIPLPGPAVTRAERVRAAAWVDAVADAPAWAVAAMEFGALVCTAAAPRCRVCPVLDACAWVAAGRPAVDPGSRRARGWLGTDRQCRGLLIQVLRDAVAPLEREEVLSRCADHGWPDPARAGELLDVLLGEGLVHEVGGYSLFAAGC